ncbi:MAG: NHLP bacteriocin system secretion protein [Desulfohalobiaceae bacterium]
MAEQKKLFRKVSLDRLSSPEELDQVLQVTTPKGWIALLTIAGLIIVALIWGIFGSIPTKVQGSGIFISGEGVRDISAPTSGQVATVYISPGQVIERGQIVARIAQPELITQISQARFKVQELEDSKQEIREFIQSETALDAKQNSRKIARIDREIDNLQEQVESLQERKENQELLLEKGLVTSHQLLETENEIKSLEQKVLQLENEKQQIPLTTLQLQAEQERKIREKQMQINEAKRELEAKQERMEETSMVYSPHSGRVLEVPVTEGSRVTEGTQLASLEQSGQDQQHLVGVIYVPADQGKRIESGMQAHLAPSTVKQEEDGSMLGMVISTGDFPATQEGMMRILRNQLLVESLSESGSPIEIFVSPIPSPDTYSGYQWTSPGGPEQTIRSGTMTSASVIVEEQAPVSLVIPWLREQLLGIGLSDS